MRPGRPTAELVNYARRARRTVGDGGQVAPSFYWWAQTGLHDELHLAKPHATEDERIAELIHKSLRLKTHHWHPLEYTGMALETGISKSAVHRFF